MADRPHIIILMADQMRADCMSAAGHPQIATPHLDALAGEGVQSLLLEGGPTLATAFVEAGLVDKLLVFITPHLAGTGPRFLGDLSGPIELSHLSAEPVGGDVLISAYVHEP